MQVTISRNGLLKAVKACIMATDKKATLPVLRLVLLEADGNSVTASATDLELAIRCRSDAKVSAPGHVALPAKKLFDYLRLLPEEDIDISVSSSSYATISCGRSRTRMAGMSKDQFPELPSAPPPMFVLPVWAVVSAAEMVAPAIAREESRFTLNGALCVLAPDSIKMAATDGHRLALVTNRVDCSAHAQCTTLIPRKAIDDIIRLAHDMETDSMVSVSEDDNHIFFDFADCALVCRKMAGSFPDYERILPAQHKIKVDAPVDDLVPAIERAKQFAANTTHAVKIFVSYGQLTITSSEDDTWESEESLSVSHSGANIAAAFNATYLLDALRVIRSGSVSILMNDPQTAAEITPAGGDSGVVFRYIVMPMRI